MVVEVIAGKDVKLVCRVKDKDVSTYWLKNNKTLDPSDHQRMRFKSNKSLKIKKTETADAGFYTCVATNDCGKNTYTIQLFVESKLLLVRGSKRTYILMIEMNDLPFFALARNVFLTDK